VSTHVGILLTAFSLALSVAAVGPIPRSFGQVAPPLNQSEQDHSAHHPGTNLEGTPDATPAPAQSGRAPIGMMGQTGMMGDMRQMMRNMMSAQSGMMSADVEGRIATLRAELKITDAQTPQWNRFADALRNAGKSMNGMFEQMMQPATSVTLPARFERQEKMLSAHLNSLRTLKDAVEPLYAALSDAQKKLADGLMIGPMGMM